MLRLPPPPAARAVRAALPQEAGLDMGGLMKEFVETLCQAGFDRNRGLFAATPDGFAFPNPLAGGLLQLVELLLLQV